MTGIRVDANETVATGHVMRCITIAKQLVKLGEPVHFFTADEYARPYLSREGLPFTVLHSRWDCLEEELPVLTGYLRQKGCARILVDSYRATPDYLKDLRRACAVIYIDDMFEEVYPVDMIINYNGYSSRFPYEKTYGPDTVLLLGPSCVPLREQFAREVTRKGAKESVLLCSGGGDTYQALAGILKEAGKRQPLKSCIFHTVVGRFHSGRQELEALARENPHIILHHDVTDMAALMEGCQTAVSAAGTMLYELCAMRTPTVFFVSADNQKYDSSFFEAEDRMLYAGDIRRDRAGCIGKICDSLEILISGDKLRTDMEQKLRGVTDGMGAVRIARAILALDGGEEEK